MRGQGDQRSREPPRGHAPVEPELDGDEEERGEHDDGGDGPHLPSVAAGRIDAVADPGHDAPETQEPQPPLVEEGEVGDPAEQKGKTLQVAYELNGKKAEASVREGETMLIPMPELKGELKLLSAEYGDLPDGPKEDVLGTVKLYLKNNRLEVDVENYLLGDPASGVFKRLRVEYTNGDVKLAKSAYEGGTLTIEVPGEAKTDGDSGK